MPIGKSLPVQDFNNFIKEKVFENGQLLLHNRTPSMGNG